MFRKNQLVVLLTFVFSLTATTSAFAQRLVVDPLLVNDLKPGVPPGVKVVEVELRIIAVDIRHKQGGDMDRIRALFGIPKAEPEAEGFGDEEASGAGAFGEGAFGGQISIILKPASPKGPIQHQVLESKPFHELLSWLGHRQIHSNSNRKDRRRMALGSTVVVVDQREPVPHLSTKEDPRTGNTVSTVEFVKQGLHLELTPVAQLKPKGKGPGEVWMIKLDRIITSPGDADDKSGTKVERVGHVVKLAAGQTALIPHFVKTSQPAYVLLSVNEPEKPKAPETVLRVTPTGELIRLATEPDGPKLADRVLRTITATPDGTIVTINPETGEVLTREPPKFPVQVEKFPVQVEPAKRNESMGAEVRALRSEVQSLRADIRKLIQIMEQQVKPAPGSALNPDSGDATENPGAPARN